jgi:hypothetical protein
MDLPGKQCRLPALSSKGETKSLYIETHEKKKKKNIYIYITFKIRLLVNKITSKIVTKEPALAVKNFIPGMFSVRIQ